MMAHLALLELPIVEPLIQDRQLPAPAHRAASPDRRRASRTTSSAAAEQFHELGCAGCHVPMMVLESPVAHARRPAADRPLARDASSRGCATTPSLGGYPVWLFSDLKRHDMGKANAAQHVQRGVAAAGVSHAATVGRRRLGAVPARRPRPELRLRDRRPRRRGRRRARGVRWRSPTTTGARCAST